MPLPIMPSINKITLSTAVSYTSKWRATHPTAIRAFTTNVNEIQQLINDIKNNTTLQVEHIRMYFAINVNNEETLVLVGVDSNNNDICEYTTKLGVLTSGTFDMMLPCPNTCDPKSPLNTIVKNEI